MIDAGEQLGRDDLFDDRIMVIIAAGERLKIVVRLTPGGLGDLFQRHRPDHP